jgi:hypothetical protein
LVRWFLEQEGAAGTAKHVHFKPFPKAKRWSYPTPSFVAALDIRKAMAELTCSEQRALRLAVEEADNPEKWDFRTRRAYRRAEGKLRRRLRNYFDPWPD